MELPMINLLPIKKIVYSNVDLKEFTSICQKSVHSILTPDIGKQPQTSLDSI